MFLKSVCQTDSDQFFGIYQNQDLEFIRDDSVVVSRGCLFVSSEINKCRWRQKGTLDGKPFETDFTGHCRIDRTEEKNNFQLDIMVWEVNIYDVPSEPKWVNVRVDGRDPKLVQFKQTTVYSGGFLFPFPTKIDSVLNSDTTDSTLKWVPSCKI